MKTLIAALVAALVAVVNVTPNRVSYACGGSVFSVPFPYLDWGDLKITSTTAAGAVTTLTPTTDFSINRTSSQTTGTVTLTAGGTAKCPNNTYILKITRTVDFTQPTPFRAQTTYNQSLHETAADRTEMQIQQLNTRVNDITSGDGGVTVQVQDEGVSQGSASILNCVGASLACTVAGSTATVNSSAPSLSAPNTWTDTQSFFPASGDKNAIVATGHGTGSGGVFLSGAGGGDAITVTASSGGYGGHFIDDAISGLALRVDGEMWIQAVGGHALDVYGASNQPAINGNGGANGVGGFFGGGGTKDALVGLANGTGGGLKGTGGDASAGTGLTQYGVRGIGGASAGAGIPGSGGYFTGGAGGNSNGVRGEGIGTGAGGAFTCDPTAASCSAITGTGGLLGGSGGSFLTQAGLSAGALGTNIGSGPGVKGTSTALGFSSGHMEAAGVQGIGLGATTAGVSGVGSGTKPGVAGLGGATGAGGEFYNSDPTTPARGSVNLATSTNDPSAPLNGDLWFQAILSQFFKVRAGGVTYTLAPIKANTCVVGGSCVGVALPTAMICTCSDTDAAPALCRPNGTNPVTFTGTAGHVLNYTCLVAQ